MVKKKKAEPKKFVWVVIHIYRHRQGCDVYVAETEADVPALVAEIIKTTLADVKKAEVRASLKEELATLNYKGALEHWNAWQENHADYPEELKVEPKEVFVHHDKPTEEPKVKIAEDEG